LWRRVALGAGQYSCLEQSVRNVRFQSLDHRSLLQFQQRQSDRGILVGGGQRWLDGSSSCLFLVSSTNRVGVSHKRLLESHSEADLELWCAVGLLHTVAREVQPLFVRRPSRS